MQAVRMLAIIGLAVGLLTTSQSKIGFISLAFAADENIVLAQGDASSTETPENDQIAAQELSEEAMAKELEEIEAAAGVEDAESIKEFNPSRPLPADLPIELPSDI